MALKFKVIGSRTVCDTEPGGTFELTENKARPGYSGGKKSGAVGINIPALLLAQFVEPADASTKKWASELEGSQYAEMFAERETSGGSNASA